MRIDNYLYQIGKYSSRTKASEAVLKGDVLYQGKPCKPSKEVEDLSLVTFVTANSKYVSNGGYKLEKVLNEYKIDLNGKIFVDIGASNGGFTDCLLQNGVKLVYAVDVGKTQLEQVLLDDNRVVVLDNTNARHLTKQQFSNEIDGVTCDVSFISATYILPAIADILAPNGTAVLLIKPQFEVGKEHLTKSGIVLNKKDRLRAINKIYEFAISCGLTPKYVTPAPIRQGKNIEYLIVLKKDNTVANPLFTIFENQLRSEL
ncbi:MAG: TlyA family RNA methyltransferase [Clostridia bacterium]|nr:TlyA family RNA methyltransferase [Clostridia bacterium]